MKVVRRGDNAILVFVFTFADFPNQQFYDAKQYIHVTQYGTENSLFVLAEAPVPADIAGEKGALEFGGNNFTDGAEANDTPNLLSTCMSTLHLEDMAELCLQGIAIDNDNNTAPENIPR